MKKLISLGMIMAMLLCSFSISFATDVTTPADEEIIPAFVNVNTVQSAVVMSGSTATYFVKVIPYTEKKIGYIDATIKLVNGNGKVIDTASGRMTSSALYKLSKSKSSVARGSYHTEYTLKIYKSGTLVETIKGKSGVTKY